MAKILNMSIFIIRVSSPYGQRTKEGRFRLLLSFCGRFGNQPELEQNRRHQNKNNRKSCSILLLLRWARFGYSLCFAVPGFLMIPILFGLESQALEDIQVYC